LSIQTYVPVDNLPAPITSGSGIQSFTDVWGDVWVAQNGTLGGAWKRARDVLHSSAWRSAAFTVGNGDTHIWPDTIDRDVYGFYNTLVGYWTTPIAGMWAVSATYALVATATAQAAFISVNNGVVNLMTTGIHASMGYGFAPTIAGTFYFGSGTQVSIHGNTNSPTLNGQTGSSITRGMMSYLGTG
jgi:hypothetical protein